MTCPTNKPKILTFGDVPAMSKPEESRGTNGKRRKFHFHMMTTFLGVRNKDFWLAGKGRVQKLN